MQQEVRNLGSYIKRPNVILQTERNLCKLSDKAWAVYTLVDSSCSWNCSRGGREERKTSVRRWQFKYNNYILDDKKHMIMVAFHVDVLDLLHGDYTATTMGFGSFGGLECKQWKPTGVKPFMIFRQDESVCSQFIIGNCQCVGPEGQCHFFQRQIAWWVLWYWHCNHVRLGSGWRLVECK